MPTPRQPTNVLLIHSDQHRFDCLGVNGHPLVPTPHLDRLAAQGVNFTSAFTPNPVCSPARACLQTGTWATIHGCVTIPRTEAFRSADPALPTLSGLMAGYGYTVGHVGKFHNEVSGRPEDHGVRDFVDFRDYHAWRKEQNLPPQPHDCGYYGQTDPHITGEQSRLAWLADHVITLLDRYRSEDRPFFLRFDPLEPHLPNVLPEPWASLIPLDSIEPWPSFPDPLDHKPSVQRRTRQRWGTDKWAWEHWAPIVQRYLGEVALLDQQVGRVLDHLDQLGIADQTLVIYSTDHGDMCGGHGMMDKHYVMYEDNMHVPLIARWPGRLPSGTTCDDFVEHELDIARTILSAAGIDAPPSFLGHALDDIAAGTASRPNAFAQYQGTHQGLYSQRMLRTHTRKYVYNPSAFDELYDLTGDPGELRNLVDEPSSAATLVEMREQLHERMQAINDPLVSPLFDWGRSNLPVGHPAREDTRL